jgi:hypothetical protein
VVLHLLVGLQILLLRTQDFRWFVFGFLLVV